MKAPPMTKQHFEYIAAIIHGLRLYIGDEAQQQVINDFADDLSNCNDAFDRDKFIEACRKA